MHPAVVAATGIVAALALAIICGTIIAVQLKEWRRDHNHRHERHRRK